MSDVVLGFVAFIALAVNVLFNVGFLTPHWVTIEETIASNSTNSSSQPPTTRTCHHGLFYSKDCPESENGLLGLASAITVSEKYDYDLLGWSFFMTVAATTIILVQVVLLLVYCICTHNTRERCTVRLVYRRHHNYE